MLYNHLLTIRSNYFLLGIFIAYISGGCIKCMHVHALIQHILMYPNPSMDGVSMTFTAFPLTAFLLTDFPRSSSKNHNEKLTSNQ